MAEELKLFLVAGKRSSSFLSRMRNYGDNYGERLFFVEHAVAFSGQEAIEQVWQRMEEQIEKYNNRAQQVKEQVEALEAAGQYREAAARAEWAFAPLVGEISPIPPSVPRDKEQWKAQEVKVDGYAIQVQKQDTGQPEGV